MIREFVEKITFLLDNNLEAITLLLSLILGNIFATYYAIRPTNPYILPMPILKTTTLTMFGSLINALILGTVTILLCSLINKTNTMKRFKSRFNSYFYDKFSITTYALYPKTHASLLVLLFSTIPFCCPIISFAIGYLLHLDMGTNTYINIIGLLLSTMIFTLFSFTSITKLVAIILYIITIMIIIIFICLPFFRVQKKVK